LFTDCQNPNREGKYGEKKGKRISGEPLSALSQKFVLAPGQRPGVGHIHGISAAKPTWVLTCPRAYALIWGERRREEPAGWQRNTLGMNCILVLTLPQAVLPDGRKFERSQL
jgi:hypothetical protein